MVALELEVLAKKFDRFGWERDRGSAAHDRTMVDWMDALQDYPLEEIQEACRVAVLSNPNKMPNEGHVRSEINKARARQVAALPKSTVEPVREKDPNRKDGYEIMKEVGFAPRKFGDSK